MKNIYLYRMITGELIISEEVNKYAESYVLKNAVKIIVIPDRNNPKNPQVGLAPWNEFSKEVEVEVSKQHVLTRTTPISEFVEQYNIMFGHIIVPPAGRIVFPS